MGVEDARQHHEPQDRLTRLANMMNDALEADPDYSESVKAIVFLNDGNLNGVGIFGYDDSTEAMSHLLVHLQAIFRASGKQMDIMFLGEGGTDRVDG